MRQWLILYVILRRQTCKNEFWGSPGPSTRGGVTKSVQKGPGRQLTKNRSNDVSRSHSGGLLEASNFFDFLGEGGGGGAESHNIQPENHFIRKFTYKMVIWPKCDPKGSKMHVFLRTK